MSFSLSVALFAADHWTSKQRLPLENSTREPDYSYFVSLGAVHSNKVLCSMCSSSELEVVTVDSSGTARHLQPIRLGFSHFCFTTGRLEGTELLLIKVDKWNELRVFEVAESLSLCLLRVIDVGCDRLLWRDGLLFAVGSMVTSLTEVNVFHVSGGGRRVQRCGTPIARADNLRIWCWSTDGNRIVLFDFYDTALRIVVYELKYWW